MRSLLVATSTPPGLAPVATAPGGAGPAPAPQAAAAKQGPGPSPFHAPPAKLVHEAAEVHRLGLFRFKGSPDPVELVQVSGQQRCKALLVHLARSFSFADTPPAPCPNCR